MPKKVAADSGFWFALFNERDKYHLDAQSIEEDLSVHSVIVPWPTLYETINTRFSRKKHNLVRLKALMDRPSTVIVDDGPYRNSSLEHVLNVAHSYALYSLVDHVIRSMLADAKLRIDAMITFNQKDFFDICLSRRIEMLPKC